MSRFRRARPLTAQETIDTGAAAARAAGLARMRDPYPPAALTEASPFHTGDRSMSVILSEPKAETAPPADPIAEWRALYHREEAYLIEQGLERRPARCDAWARTVAAMQAKEPGLGHYDAEAALHRGGLAHPNPTGRWASLRPGDICSPGSTAPPAIAQQQQAPPRPRFDPSRLMTEDRYALADIFMDAVLTAHGERPVAVADLPVEAVDALRILAGGREVDAADARGVVIGQEIPLGSARPRDHRAVIVVERGAGRVITVIAVAPVRHASPRPSDEGGLAVVHDAIGAEEDALLAQSDAWDRHSIESQEQRRAWAFNTVAARIAAARGVQAHIVAADLRAAGIY